MTLDPERVAAYCQEAASSYGVSPALHPRDYMLRYQLDSRPEATEEAFKGYFRGGHADALTFASIARELLGAQADTMTLLEFASGYGRVSRFLPKLFPHAIISAADIHSEAVAFVNDELAIPSWLSSTVPEELAPPTHYDVIFCLSFFSHMPHATFGRWLVALHARLKPGGLLIFTTGSRTSMRVAGHDANLLDANGSVFLPKSEQEDLDGAEYGGMFVKPEYVIDQIWHYCKAPIMLFREQFWWKSQDLWVVTKR